MYAVGYECPGGHVVASCVSRVTTSRRIPVRTTPPSMCDVERVGARAGSGCRSVDHTASLKLKLIHLSTTPGHVTCRRSWGGHGSSRDRFQQDSSSQHVDQVSSSGAPSWARADQEPPPARAWSPPTPTTAPSEAPSPGETPRDPKQPRDPNTAMKVGARSARDRHRRARGRSRGARGRFGAQLTWEAEIARCMREIRSSVDLGGGGGGGGAVPRARLLIRAQL